MTRNDPSILNSFPGRVLRRSILACGLLLATSPAVIAQVPGLSPPAKAAAPPKADPSQQPVPAKDGTGTTFATTKGPIAVVKKVEDADIQATLADLLGQYPGVYVVDAHVQQGVVRLEGHADDDDTINEVTAFAEKVEGVRLVLNKMRTDADVLTGRQMAMKILRQYARVVQSNWLLAILAIGSVVGFAMLARVFARSSETLLSPLIRNPLLRSVAGSILSTLIVLGGVLLGLSVLNLTHAVVSVLGLAGVVGLALGFAFKDITENFIASMLLGLRRPFQIGDFITVAGKSGSVLSLNTRATLLITPEGNHVLIPNSVIYKETLVNSSATPSSLGSMDLVVPYEASTAGALEAINEALRSTEGLLQEPTPRALVQSLETNGVHIRATYWMPTKGVDGDKLQSDLRLKVKVALQKAGINPTPIDPPAPVSAPVPASAELPEVKPGKVVANNQEGVHAGSAPSSNAGAVGSPSRIEDNLQKDSKAAEAASAGVAEPEASPIDHAIRQAEANAMAEGNNMLVNGKA